MEEILKQFEQQDSFIDCLTLLNRWKDVPHFKIIEATDVGILFPFTSSFDYKSGRTIKVPFKLSSICDDEGDFSIDVEEATRQGILFSLANVLLLENKYTYTFAPLSIEKNVDGQNLLAMSLIGRNEELNLENASLRTKYKTAISELSDTLSKLEYAKQYIERLEIRIKEYGKVLSKKENNMTPCIGQGGCRFVCDNIRRGVKEKEISERLYNSLGIRSKSAIGFFLCTNSKLESELKFENNPKDSKENKRKRLEGYYNSIMGYSNK